MEAPPTATLLLESSGAVSLVLAFLACAIGVTLVLTMAGRR